VLFPPVTVRQPPAPADPPCPILPTRSYNLERGPGRLGQESIGLLSFVRVGLLGFDQPGLRGLGPAAFFPALIAMHLAWCVARAVAAFQPARKPWTPQVIKAVPA
jgi:hypothetical protein